MFMMRACLGFAICLLVGSPMVAALRKHDCDHPCTAGYCLFEDCDDAPSCPGGLCEFHRCTNPDCGGGACTFHECSHATCPGGGCKFFNPKTTLVDGYCEGGACHLNGKEWKARFTDGLSF